MDFQSSRTYANLQIAYEDALRANAKYGLFSKKANQDVLMEISFIFNTASRNEQFVAERLRNILNGGTPTTLQNLGESSNYELEESSLYRDFARIANEEGYTDIASLFSGIANIKLNHNYTFQTLITEIQNNELFCKPNETLWVCLGCGNILSGLCAPDICPICGYPQGYYELYRPLR
ncbi:rubrerythrin family protein [Lachnospiraceae bacterium MD1]|uniref:Rubrerythrin family protein n=1 Tax=Variimorphobacter saccharofermentans TaxID=2755051 RepID=A0A839JYY9_9FIRM|nr:ferritin family protein [Variimorphobacter saccharofermentans]MBB2182427.1 rubrerythrin family protein [Variimorphobacter saccharofermentans]